MKSVSEKVELEQKYKGSEGVSLMTDGDKIIPDEGIMCFLCSRSNREASVGGKENGYFEGREVVGRADDIGSYRPF